jgi:hypothetical protein
MDDRSIHEMDKFLGAISNYIGMWTVLDLKIAAIKKEDSYELIGMLAVFEDKLISAREILVDLPELLIIHKVIELNKDGIIDFINELKAAKIDLDGTKIHLNNFNYYRFGASLSHSASALAQKPDWPYTWLESTGNKPIREYIDEDKIKNQLIGSGYEDLMDAFEELIGLRIGGSHSPIINLIAPIYIMPNIQIRDEFIDLDLVSHISINVADLVISCAASSADATTKRGQVSFNEKDFISREDNFVHYCKKINLPVGIKSIKLWTIYKKTPIYEKNIYDSIGFSSEIDPKWKTINLGDCKRSAPL